MSTVQSRKKPAEAEPAWDVARLYPNQGVWSEDEYFFLPGNHLVEFDNGFIEILPMPTTSHQLILSFLFQALVAYAKPSGLGTALFAALPVRLWKGKFREPDVVFMLAKHVERIGEQYWRGADLVMEVVSDGRSNRKRDLVIKRAEYARARIAEYWIVDPQQAQITVLRLSGRKYVVQGEYGRGTRAASHLLDGFEVAVDAVFDAP